MHLFRTFTTISMVLALSAVSFAAKTSSGKVRAVIGDVSRQKKADDAWAPLRVGAKVQEKDKIKTLMESQVTIALPDGSTISVEENSVVEFSELVSANGMQVTMTEVKSGKIRFDVQKQMNSNSSFKFKSGTATAAIRGTDGTIALTEGGQTIGALNNGAMDMEENGQKVQVKAKQFVAFRKDQPPVVGEAKNASDPEFIQKIGEAIDDPNKSADEILATAKTLDTQIDKNKEDLKKKFKCEFEPIPATVDTNTVTIKGTCSAGMKVSLGAETIESTGAPVVFTPSWSRGAIGPKKFIINCTVEKTNFECGYANTTYENPRTVAFGNENEQECSVPFSTHGFEDNMGSLKFSIDGKNDKAFTLENDTTGTLQLIPGTHTYSLVTMSAEGKEESVAMKKMNCFPVTEVAVEIKNGTTETIQKRLSQGSSAYPELRFAIKNILGNDPAQLQSVIVKVGDTKFDTKFEPSTTDISYKSKVKVNRGTTKVDVIVTMKNGKVVRASKTYILK